MRADNASNESRPGPRSARGGRRSLRIVRRVLAATGYGLAGVVVTALVFGIVLLEDRPDLDVWHTTDLDEELTSGSDVASFTDYLALEDRLFAQLDAEVVSNVPTGPGNAIRRYSRNSRSDPARWPVNWNRTFELPVDNPTAGVLLLHGMSDSPYSLRALGESLHEKGAWVLGLRLPGHGTAPSGLVTARWEDMAAAVELGVRYVAERTAGRPLYLVGYSNGGALAVDYAAGCLENQGMPRASGLVLISPSIGVSALADFAVWQARLGRWLGLRKLAWNTIEPEYDPFKYGSFAVNAGDQVARLTARIRGELVRLRSAGRLGELPPILAFQSAVDATVSTPALIEGLFALLPPSDRNELILFDINRQTDIESVLAFDPRQTLEPLLAGPTDFTVSVVTNETEASRAVVLRRRIHGRTDVTEEPLDLEWPPGIYSLSHVALPFPPDDPLYGGSPGDGEGHLVIGSLAARGERGVLRISGDAMLRLRWNPFYGFLEERVLQFTKVE